MPKITWKPGTMLSPLPPALVSSGTVEKPNVMTVAWTGIIASEPALTYVSIRPSRFSHDIIKESGEFVINLPNLALLTATDFCGVKSGRDTDKFAEMNLTAKACSEVSAPQIEEAPVSLECKVKSVTSYGSHDMFLAEIVAVNVDDKYVNKEGKLCLEKAGLIAYSHGTYFTLGRELGTFGFSVNKKRLAQMEKMKSVEVVVVEPKIVDETAEKKERVRRPSRPTRDSRGRSDDKPRGDRPDRKPREDRDGGGERRPYRPREGGDGERKPFRPREDRGDRPYTPRKPREDGDRPFKPRGDKPFAPRKPREDGERSERPYTPRKPREDGDRPRRDFGDKPRSGGGGRGGFGGGRPQGNRDGAKRGFAPRGRK